MSLLFSPDRHPKRSSKSVTQNVLHLQNLPSSIRLSDRSSNADNKLEQSGKGFIDLNSGAHDNQLQHQYQHLYVLPVLLLEFLALALTRAVLPSILLREYGNRVYMIMGCADFVRGLLAFFACPMFGKLSDIVGRRICLFVTVLGTCAPVCSLALFSWQETSIIGGSYNAMSGSSLSQLEDVASDETPDILSSSQPTTGTTMWGEWVPPYSGKETHPLAITIFVLLLALSGFFASTFTLVFAYISDTVKEQDERVSAYGLALATFGLSFTLGPMLGGYLAQTDQQYVFLASLLLTVLDLLYIYFVLPESKALEPGRHGATSTEHSFQSSISLMTMDHKFSWNPMETLRIVILDPFLRQVGKVAFLYYTGLWALISTLSVYAVQRFHLSPERLGELISILGLSTMIAEAALVRILVPLLGEKVAMKLGLASFCLQCLTLGFAYEGWHLFVCAGFSLLGNLVYPSLTSLVSGSVEPDAVGEALGAINGIKALTEGIGPLFFGTLMTISEKSVLPGWPYLLAAVLVAAAYLETNKLPDIEEDDYVHELDRKRRHGYASDSTGILMSALFASKSSTRNSGNNDEELDGLLSEIDDGWDDDEDAK
jgi:MFS transporter, DHA1 family, tetracycline resistance protein